MSKLIEKIVKNIDSKVKNDFLARNTNKDIIDHVTRTVENLLIHKKIESDQDIILADEKAREKGFDNAVLFIESFMQSFVDMSEPIPEKVPYEKIRIRIMGKNIGQFDKELLEIYQSKYSFENLNNHIRYMIENLILYHSISTPNDIDTALEQVENLYCRSIAEYLEAYMRQDVFDIIPVCGNCQYYDQKDHYCSNCILKVNPLNKGCESFKLK